MSAALPIPNARPSVFPGLMHCIEVAQPGGPEVMHLEVRPIPQPGPDDVLIRVVAAGVNGADLGQRAGIYPPPLGASPVLGLEVAGEIVAIGKDVRHWRVGHRVCALVNGGGYAAFCLAPQGQILPIPHGLDDVEAASLPEACFTVWSNVFERAKLAPGEWLLVHGGTSGIGVAAIQMARLYGARVIATAGSDSKCKSCLALGAEAAINYREQDFVAEAKRITNGHGVDVILDMIAGDYVQRNVEALALDGRIGVIAFRNGSQVSVDMSVLIRKRGSITGSLLRPRPDAYKATVADALRKHVWPWLERGTMMPLVHETFPLSEAAAAHRLMESSRHVGKIVLIP